MAKTYSVSADLVMTLISLANGAGRMGAEVDNSTDLYERIHWKVTVDILTGNDDNSQVEVYAYRADQDTPEFTTDAETMTNSALTPYPVNATPIGVVRITGITGGVFTAEGVWDDPGIGGWSIGLWNAAGVAFAADEATSYVHWVGEKA